MFPNIPGKARCRAKQSVRHFLLTAVISAFWGQSFVAELTRISAQGEKKLKARRASLIRPPTQGSIPQQTTEPEKMDTESKASQADEAGSKKEDDVPEQAELSVRSRTT